jgi:hypothetical protein
MIEIERVDQENNLMKQLSGVQVFQILLLTMQKFSN